MTNQDNIRKALAELIMSDMDKEYIVNLSKELDEKLLFDKPGPDFGGAVGFARRVIGHD